MTYRWHTSTDEWYTDDIRVRVTYEWHTSTYEWHASTYEYIRVTYSCHTSTYGWHTSTHEWHTMTCEYIRVTCELHRSTYKWHTDNMRLERKIKFTFLKLFDNPYSNIWFVKEFLACNGCFRLFPKIKKRPGISFWCIFLHVIFIQMLLFNTLSIDKVSMSYFCSFWIYQTKRVIKFLFRQLMTS